MPVSLERTDTSDTAQVRPGVDPVVVHGLPSEIVLDLFGRRAVADVRFTGPAESVAAFRARSFGA
jgi:hypothetical protein